MALTIFFHFNLIYSFFLPDKGGDMMSEEKNLMETETKVSLRNGDGYDSDEKSTGARNSKRGRLRKRAKVDGEVKEDVTLCEADTTTLDDEPKRKVPRGRKPLTLPQSMRILEVR